MKELQEKVLKLCKELGKKVEEFDCGYRQTHNCRIINGKPYCTALVNARNKTLEKEVKKVLSLFRSGAKEK